MPCRSSRSRPAICRSTKATAQRRGQRGDEVRHKQNPWRRVSGSFAIPQLNASNFFSRQQDQLKRNQAGFTLGGPLRRNKLFAFGGYQQLWIRTASGATRVQTLTAAERRGDFSSNPITIYDPLIPGSRFRRTSSRRTVFRPAALKLLTVSPLPDADGFTRFTICHAGKRKAVHRAPGLCSERETQPACSACLRTTRTIPITRRRTTSMPVACKAIRTRATPRCRTIS